MFLTLTDQQKGIIMMGSGLILLLHTLGVLEKWLSYFLIAGSLVLICYGFFKSGYFNETKKLIQKK